MPEMYMHEILSNTALLRSIREFNLNARTLNCLLNEVCTYEDSMAGRKLDCYVIDVITKTDSELLRIPNFGRKCLNDVINKIVNPLNIRYVEILDAPSDRREFRRLIEDARANPDKHSLAGSWPTVDPDKRALAERTYSDIRKLAIEAGNELTDGNLPKDVEHKAHDLAAAIARNSKPTL